MGISLKKINKIKNNDELLEELVVVSNNIEGEIKKLKELKIGVDKHIKKLKSTPKINKNFEIKIVKLAQRKFQKIEFETISTIDSPKLYQIGMELKK